MSEPARRKKVRLGELLVEQKIISDAQLASALGEQKRTGRKLGRVLTDLGLVEESRLHEVLAARYADEAFVRVHPFSGDVSADERAFDPRAANGTNRIDLWVLPNPLGHVLLVATLDNLGKGASGAAVQNLNLMLGFDEKCGLEPGAPGSSAAA